MAFGGVGGGNEDITFKVFLDVAQASGDAEKFFNDFIAKTIQAGRASEKLGKESVNALGQIKSAASSPIQAIGEVTKKFIDANPAAKEAANALKLFAEQNAALITKMTLTTAGVALLAIGFNKLRAVAAEGDQYDDISQAFQENADKAGVLASVLEDRLSKAFNETLSQSQVLAQANKLFASGLNPEAFDDLAAASKRYADSFGGDAVQALEQFTRAIATGNETILKKIGTVKDGVLVLKEFTQAEFLASKATENVTDVNERFAGKIKTVYEELAKAVNNSSAMKLASEALGSVTLKLAEAFGGLAKAVLSVANFIADQLNTAISGLAFGVVYLSETLTDLKNGDLPDFSRAFKIASQQFGVFEAATNKSGKAVIKLGGDLGKSGKQARDFQKEIKEALQQSEININDALGLESFAASELGGSLRDSIITALKQVNLVDIGNSLRGVRKTFLDGITGTPEEIQKQVDERIKIFEKELQKSKDILEGGTTVGQKGGEPQDIGKVFGFTFDGLDTELAGQITGAITSAFSIATQAITSGIGREDAAPIGAAIGQTIGSFFGPEYAQVGNLVGTIIGDIASEFGKDSAGTQARKAADKFFADMFNAERLSVIVNDQIKRINDLQFTGNEEPDAEAFAALSPQTQQSFDAVGAAFEQLLGISEDYSGRIAAVLFGNVGDSLVNLQALVQSTGKSFEDLGNAIFESFFNGNLSIQELQDSLVRLNELFSVGIPGEIGAIDQAVQNLNVSLQDDKGSRIIFNSLRGIGAEAQEVGKNLGQAAQSIATGLGLGADKVALFLQAMKLAGINNIKELVEASNAQLAALAANILQVTQGATPTNSEVVVPTTTINSAPNFTPVSLPKAKSSGTSAAESAAKKAAAERARLLAQLQAETIKLVTASAAYGSIIDKVNASTINANRAGDQINDLYDRQFKILQKVEKAQKAYDEALKKGTKGKALTDLAKQLEDANKAAKQFTTSINNTTKLNLSGITNLIRDMNTLGVVSRAVGVDTEALTSTLIQGFLRGKLSIRDVNDQIAQTKDLLGDGIPGAIGDINAAFSNLQKGGRQGGLFSVDAFKDIFAEFDELFKKNGSPARKAQFEELTKSFNDTRDALQKGIKDGGTPKQIEILRDAFNGAQKALNDFNETIPKADLEDLRTELKKTFSPEQVDIFFEGLRSSGVTSFDELKNLSTDAVVAVLGELDRLGFDFAASTDANTKKILDAFDAANTAQTQGKDILGEQIKLIGDFLNGAAGLPPVFNDAASALGAFEAPLSKLNDAFGSLLFNLSQFERQNYDKDILLNVDLNAKNSQTQSLLDLLFGDGAGIIDTNTGTPGTGGGGLTTAEKREFFALRRRAKNGKLSAADQRRFNELKAKRG